MKTVVIFGGSGFVGRHIIRKIVKKGHKIIIPHQSQVNEAKLRLLGTTGQVIPLKYRNLKEEKVTRMLNAVDLIINLKTLWDEKKITFKKGILDFNINLVDFIRESKSKPQFIYFSGIGIDKRSDSERTRAIFESEEYIKKNLINSVIIRPGIIIGGGDNFLKGLMPIFKLSFFIPLFGNGLSRFQPVFIDDVATGVNKILESNELNHQTYEFVGLRVYTYREFYTYLSECIEKTRVLVPIPLKLVKIGVSIMNKLSLSPLSLEQLKLFEEDNICSNSYKKLEDLGILPQDLSEIIKKIIKLNA